MGTKAETNQTKILKREGKLSVYWIPLSFFALEIFAFSFLADFSGGFQISLIFPLLFGACWAVLFTGILRMIPRKVSRVLYGILYYISFIYSGAQTGYSFIFNQIMWVSDFRYASEGSDYFEVIFTFPILWWIGLAVLLLLGIWIIWKFPEENQGKKGKAVDAIISVAAAVILFFLPELAFMQDRDVKFAGSDYSRALSAEAAYDNLFNAKRLYDVCGLYQMAARDIYVNHIYPATPGYTKEREEKIAKIDAYFEARPEHEDNEMTGIFKDKNVILVLMESMDDWMIGEYTPTISRLMSEGINFTSFYTPVYGGIRTFNTEYCTNTGSFLSSQGGFAFDYVTNDYHQSFPNLMRDNGYTAKTFHFNDPSFYSRGEFSPAMGYEDYICYADYTDPEDKKILYDDKLVMDNPEINDIFFRDAEKRLNFIITRAAHMSYVYNEVVSNWGLKLYPEFRGLTGHEEKDCAYLKARLVDDMYTRIMEELEEKGELEDTVIIGITDHYTYGFEDKETLMEVSGVDDPLLLEKTPCFIWSADIPPMEIDKTLNTSDMLPTMLNLFGIESPYHYIGHDAFDEDYEGIVPFSDGSWIRGEIGYNSGEKKILYLTEDAEKPSEKELDQIMDQVSEIGNINNMILDTNYYGAKTEEMEE